MATAHRGGPFLMARSLWEYRSFIAGLVLRDFRQRYLRSVLGTFWAVLQPLALLAVYAVVFSEVMRARLPGNPDRFAYSLFLMAGLFPWTFFSDTLSRCQGIFLEHGNLIRKAAFPRSSLPIAAALSAAVGFGISLALFLSFLGATGRWPGQALWALLPLLLLQQALAMGLGVLVGTVQVFFRDAGHAVGIALQFWFWLTPIIYPLEAVPEAFRPLFRWNPMTPLAQAFQQIALAGVWPSWKPLLPLMVVSALLLALSYVAFRSLSGQMADEL